MSFWDSYGPTLAKQVELISNLTLKNNDLEARLTALSGELQKSNADLKEAQESCALLSEQNQHLLQLVEEERARAEQSWRSHLTIDQFVTAEQYADVIKQRDDLIKQNQILTDQLRNAETESEEEPATVGRRRGRTSSKN